MQQFKSNSAPQARADAGRNGASSSGGDNNNWAGETNTSYNLLDGTVSHTSHDFRTVHIANSRSRVEPDADGGADRFANFRGMTDFRKEENYGRKKNIAAAAADAPKNQPRVQEIVSKKKPRWRSPSPPKESPRKNSKQQQHHNNNHRRHSDISTLELESSPTREPFRRVHGKPKFSESYDGNNGREARSQVGLFWGPRAFFFGEQTLCGFSDSTNCFAISGLAQSNQLL